MDIIAYALSRKYTEESMDGVGYLKGAPCTIKSINKEDGINTVTFEWTANDGTTRESVMLVKDGSISEVNPTLTSGVKIAEIILDGEPIELFAPEGSEGSGTLTDDLNVTRTVGGISSGKNYADGTSLEQIFRDMLNPTDYPTLTNPSATLTATGAKLLEKGSTLNTTMTVSFNRGSINPAYGTSGYRSGVATGYSLNGGASQSGNTFSVTVDELHLTYSGTVSYAAGEQPKDSTGANYSTPLPAGNVTSNTLTYEFVDALWANTASSSAIAKLELVSKTAKQNVFNFPPCSSANPETFDIPATWTVTAVEVKNDLTGSWDDCTAEFNTTTATHSDASGATVDYTRYVCNLGYDMGSREIKVKWS